MTEKRNVHQITDDIKKGNAYSFPGRATGKTFTISHNGKNFILEKPKQPTKGMRRLPDTEALSLSKAEIIIGNSLMPLTCDEC